MLFFQYVKHIPDITSDTASKVGLGIRVITREIELINKHREGKSKYGE